MAILRHGQHDLCGERSLGAEPAPCVEAERIRARGKTTPRIRMRERNFGFLIWLDAQEVFLGVFEEQPPSWGLLFLLVISKE